MFIAYIPITKDKAKERNALFFNTSFIWCGVFMYEDQRSGQTVFMDSCLEYDRKTRLWSSCNKIYGHLERSVCSDSSWLPYVTFALCKYTARFLTHDRGGERRAANDPPSFNGLPQGWSGNEILVFMIDSRREGVWRRLERHCCCCCFPGFLSDSATQCAQCLNVYICWNVIPRGESLVPWSWAS